MESRCPICSVMCHCKSPVAPQSYKAVGSLSEYHVLYDVVLIACCILLIYLSFLLLCRLLIIALLQFYMLLVYYWPNIKYYCKCIIFSQYDIWQYLVIQQFSMISCTLNKFLHVTRQLSCININAEHKCQFYFAEAMFWQKC